MADSESVAARRLLDDDGNDYVSRERAAVILGMSVSTVDRLRKSGKLRSERIDHRIVIRRRWIDEMVAAGVLLALCLLAVFLACCLFGVESIGDALGGCPAIL